MSEHLIVSEAARTLTAQLGEVVRPRAISELFYRRLLEDSRCPIVGGRRLIPPDYLPTIADALKGQGLIRREVRG
jgi:hypothetical protein